MALSRVEKANIESYVRKKIVSTGTVSEIKDLLLYFSLIRQDKDYCKLASFTNRVYEICGFEHASEGVYRLDHHLGRRFKFSLFCCGKRINFDNPAVIDYLLQRIELEMKLKLSGLANIYDSHLAKTYPELLAALLDNLRKVQQYDNEVGLTKIQIRRIVGGYFSRQSNPRSIIPRKRKVKILGLSAEFFRLQRVLKEVFSLHATAQSIVEQRDFFISLAASGLGGGAGDIIAQTLSKARGSRFLYHGADYHVRPGIHAAITTQLIAVVATLAITAILQWAFPLIPIVGLSSAFIAMVGAVAFALIQIPISTYLYSHLVHRREKKDNIIKGRLILSLGKAVPMYQERLNQSGFDLGMFSERNFEINPHARSSLGFFGGHRRNPSTGEGFENEDNRSDSSVLGLLSSR